MKKIVNPSNVFLTITMLALVSMPFSSKAGEWPEEKVEWKLAAGPEGTLGYMSTTILAKVLSDNIKNFSAYPEAGGAVKSLRLLGKGQRMMIWGNTATMEHAYLNRAAFQKNPLEGSKPQIAALVFPFTFFMVAKKDSNIHTMDDLAGKTITISSPSYGIFPPAYDVMKSIGLWDKTKHRDVSWGDYAGSITGGVVDSLMIYIVADSTTSGTIRNVEMRMDMRALTFTEEQQKIINGLPGIRFRKAKNIFPEIESDTVGGWSYFYGWFFHPDVNEKLAYEIVKTIYEKREELAKANKSFTPWKNEPIQLSKEAISASPDVPVHPGATKFFKEIGAQ